MSNIIEHIPGYELSHLFSELDRVLVPGGTVEINLPHAGTYGAGTDPTHMGAGGTTADFAEYFGGNLENYWSEFNWDVESWAEVTFPVFFPSGLQIRKRINSGLFSMQMVKLPFVTGTVEVRVTKFAEE